MLKLDLAAAERFIAGYKVDRKRATWDGWDILLWSESPAGATHRKGAFVDGKWGIQQRISPNSEGKWLLRV